MENEEIFICQDILELILLKLPLKSRTKFKSVSKSWNSLITYLRHMHPPTTTSGLAFSFKKPSINRAKLYELTLLDVQDKGDSCLHTTTTSITHNLPGLIDSCNGLLLFGAKEGSFMTYHVLSPLKNQWLKLPCTGHDDFLRPSSASLAFDGVQQNFKVICLFWEEADIKNGNITYQIFSSKTWQWRENNARIENSVLLLSKDFNRQEWSCPSLYRKGQVYWIWSLYLLVFDEDKESIELIELPKNKNHPANAMSMYCAKRLWESGKRLHYCDSTACIGFFIWEYEDDFGPDDNYKVMWLPRHFIQWDGLVSRIFEVFQNFEDMAFSISPSTVKPCAFDEDLEILYFQLPGFIAAYSFETREVVKVKSGTAIGQNMHDNISPFVFKAVDLHR